MSDPPPSPQRAVPLEGERVGLRPAASRDAAAFAAVLADPDVARW